MAEKKFSPMRYTASTEEAAINGALQIVGATRDEIEYEIIDQSDKGVTVRIRPRLGETLAIAAPLETSLQDSAPIAEDVPELFAQSDEVQVEAESEIEAQIGGDLASHAADFAAATPGFEAEVEGETVEVKTVEVEAAPSEKIEPEVAVEIPPLDPEVVARAQQKAQEILDKMGLDAQAQIDVIKEVGVVALVVEGDDVGILIGKHGATLQAFQYLLNLTLNAHLQGEAARQNGARVVVDAGNYRARRQVSLEQIARGAASKVRREGRVVRLEPMPAHERRLVHLFLQAEAEIVTQSEGREPMRRIVVSPPLTGSSPAPVPIRAERAPDASRSGFGSFRRGDAQSERNRGLQRGR